MANTIGFSGDCVSQVATVKAAIDNTQQIYVLINYNSLIGESNQENRII
jgi:hypothetical protein